jgi:spermidine/putrescine transport system permease protein
MMARNPWILLGRLWLGLAYAFMFLPLVVLILFSFQKNRFPGFPLQGWTTGWYGKLFSDGTLLDALGHTMIVSPAAATVATVIAFFAAYALNRFHFRGKTALLGLVTLPILIPPLILGVGFLGLLARVHLSGTLFAVFLTHVVLITAPALAIIQLRLAQMPGSLEEAAWDLGATEWQTVCKVVLPFALPGIFGAWLLAFTFSFDEFIIAWFVSGFQPTLPVAIYSVLVAAIDPSLNAIGTIVFAISCAVLIGIELILLPFLVGKPGGDA